MYKWNVDVGASQQTDETIQKPNLYPVCLPADDLDEDDDDDDDDDYGWLASILVFIDEVSETTNEFQLRPHSTLLDTFSLFDTKINLNKGNCC